MRLQTLTVAFSAACFLASIASGAQEYATVRDVEGKAFVQAYDEKEPMPLTVNTPLTDSDNLWTQAGGRVGLLLKDGNRLWLDESSRLEVEQFPGADATDERTLKARLWKGSALLDVASWNGKSAEYMITTPSAVVTLQEEGLFLVQIETVDRTRVTSLRGRCTVASSGGTATVDTQQTTYVEYGYPPLQPAAADLSQASTLVEFRNLATRARKPSVSGGQSQKYLSPDLYAYAPDLDENGSWTSVDGYGDCWVPDGVDSDWTPYSDGRWTYTSWGLTWVPYEPWGWVPFHYGSWLLAAGFGWAWCPGYTFAPAWCSWYWGPDYFGWCPLDCWGYPLWNSCGWYSCGMGNIYAGNGPYVHHRTAPPPNPIYPRPNPTPGRISTRTGEPRVTGHSTGPNVTPRDVRDYGRGKLTADQLKARSIRPMSRPAGATLAQRSMNPDGEALNRNPRPGSGRTGSSDALARPARPDGTRASRPSDDGSAARAGGRAARPSGDAPNTENRVNPRRSWSQSSTPSDGDATRRSRGSARQGNGDLTNPRAQRANPLTDPSYSAPREPRQDSYGRSSRGYRGDGGYDATPRPGRESYGRTPRSYDGSGARAIPSRPSPPSGPQAPRGYSPGRSYGGGSGRSAAPPPSHSAPPSSGGSHSSGGGSHSSGGGHRR